MSPRLLSTAIAPSAAAATAAAAAPVAPTDDSQERRCEPVVDPSLADPIEVRAEAPEASSGERLGRTAGAVVSGERQGGRWESLVGSWGQREARTADLLLQANEAVPDGVIRAPRQRLGDASPPLPHRRHLHRAKGSTRGV